MAGPENEPTPEIEQDEKPEKKTRARKTKAATEPPNLYQRLHAVMEEISYVQKESKKVNNQFTYPSHDAVTAKVRGSLVTHRVLAVPSVNEFKQDGNRTSAGMTITFINIDAPEEQMAVDCFGYGVDSQDKGPGKAVSYAVKYGLLKIFMLETGDDPEQDVGPESNYNQAPQHQPKKEPAKKPPQERQQRQDDPNTPPPATGGKPATREEYQSIMNIMEACQNDTQCIDVWNENLDLINRMPEQAIANIEKAKDRFDIPFT